MKKLLLILFMVGCGAKPIIPERITVDAPEEITVKHEISWSFVDEYCTNIAATNNQLEECVNEFIEKFTVKIDV
ncbi:MAG: hypothetical protein CMG00_05980 [Candidatus Marinimicrobia bacterium]|nr:hypothetical protein [Candidatus Neomarinimicrobiota bacterium]|tara:strand:+ start:2535 stop:2756 length:222 start_codon:yes stop_codon:yes gene_type:complete